MARVHGNIFDNFSEEALEALDFARCQRADGSFYGTSGQCRKGKETSEKPAEAPKAKPRASVSKEEKADRRAAARKDNEEKAMRNARTDSKMTSERAAQVKAAFDKKRKSDKAAESKPGRAEKIAKLRASVDEAKKAGDKKKLKGLRHDLQILEKTAKLESQAKKTGRSVDDIARERNERATAKVRAELAARYPNLRNAKFLEGAVDRYYDLKEKKKKGKSEKMCNQYRPWAPLGMQNAIVPCRELGLK